MIVQKRAFLSLIVFFMICPFYFAISCKQTTDSHENKETQPVTDKSSGYMSKSDWENAKVFLNKFEDFNKKEMDAFLTASGLAIQFRDFGQYEQALDASKKIPATIDLLESAISKFKPVPNYPETEELIKNLAAMPPHLRKYAKHLEQSLASAVAGNTAAANSLKEIYTNDHRNAMKYYRKAFDFFQEILIRGSRTESQKFIGDKSGGPEVIANFKKTAQSIKTKYNEIIAKQLPLINNHIAARQYDQAFEKSEHFYISIQVLIMDLNQLEPGNEKLLWDGKQIITTALSYKLYAAQKQKEFIQNTKANHPNEAIAAKKQYELFNKMADEEWVKYRRKGL